MGRKKQPNGYLSSARERRGTTYKRAPTMFYKAQKLKENCGVETTILMYNKDDMGTYHLYTTEPQELLIVLQRYVQVLQDNLHGCAMSGMSEADKCRNGVKPGECYILANAPFNASFRMRAEKTTTSNKAYKKRKSPSTSGKIVEYAKKSKISKNTVTAEQQCSVTACVPHSHTANVQGGSAGPEKRAELVDNTHVYEDVFTELIGMGGMDMDINMGPSIKAPIVHVAPHVHTKQTLAQTTIKTPQMQKNTPHLLDSYVNTPNTVNAMSMSVNIATTMSGHGLTKYHTDAPPEQHTNKPHQHKKTDKEIDSEIQQMVREIQSSFDTSAANADNTPQHTGRKENTHFFSRFVL